MHVERLAVVVLQDVAVAAVQHAFDAVGERAGVFARVLCRVRRLPRR